MNNLELVKKVIGNIHPAGDASRDGERFENLKQMCTLIADLVYEVEQVALNNESAYEFSVVKARNFAYEFLSAGLGIEYTVDAEGNNIEG